MNEKETSYELITRSTFWKIITSLVPNEYLETVDDKNFVSMKFTKNLIEHLVQYVLDNSNRKMRMYGSAEEFTAELNGYRLFPMSHKFFECERSEPYNSKTIQYPDTNGKGYISKESVLIFIQIFIRSNFSFIMNKQNSLILTLFLKIQEEKLKNCLEFIPLDVEFDNYMQSELEKTIVASKEERYNHPEYSYSLEDYIDLFTKLLPESCTAKEIASVRERVIKVYNVPIIEIPSDWDDLLYSYIDIKYLLNFVKRLTEKRPQWFLRWTDIPPEMHFKVPAIVRLFKGKLVSFFIEAELEEAIKIYQTGHAQPSKTIEGNFLYTIEYVAAWKKYGMDLSKLTIIHDNTSLTYAEITPIPTNFGVFIINGLHAFYRLFRRIIFVHKVFQKLTSDNMEPFNIYLEIIDKELDLRGTRKYMLKYDAFNRLEKITADYWNAVLPQSAKDVRDVKPDGFTLQSLKNELAHLGLTNAVPDIVDYAESAYERVLKTKREKYLRTCDLFSAIERCQLLCITTRYPIVSHFLKTHGVCEESETCVETKEELEVTESTNQENDELKTVKAQLKAAKDQIKQFEDRKLDEKLSECQLEIESLKKELEGQSNFASEIENLKKSVETGEDREQKLKEANQSLTDCIKEMKKNMSKLEAGKLLTTEIDNELIKQMVDLKGKLQSAESRLESVAVEKDGEISILKEEKKQDAELILKLEGEVKKEQKQNERQKLESELRLEVEKTNHAVDQNQLEKEFSRLRDVCDKKDQIIQDLRNRLSKFPGGLP